MLGRLERKRPRLVYPGTEEYNKNNIQLYKTKREDIDWVCLAQDWQCCCDVVNKAVNVGFQKC
jgi:hypothetical protein